MYTVLKHGAKSRLQIQRMAVFNIKACSAQHIACSRSPLCEWQIFLHFLVSSTLYSCYNAEQLIYRKGIFPGGL